jgi:hypothetical protein
MVSRELRKYAIPVADLLKAFGLAGDFSPHPCDLRKEDADAPA